MTEKKQSAPGADRTRKPESPTADRKAGTETELKGGSEPAKSQAERDWQNSSQEAGE